MDDRRNNFDALRLLAAILVIFGHAYGLNGFKSPLQSVVPGLSDIPEGTLAVYIFFVISGYLIPKSYLSRHDWRQYLKARLLRIIPALAVVILLCVFVLGPLVTDLSVADYFASRPTWAYLKTIIPINIKYQLPGVFQHNTYGVNGSLWSIKVELRAYLIVLVLGVLHILRYRYVMLAMWAILYLGYVHVLPVTIKDHIYYLMFFSGTLFFLFRDTIPLKPVWGATSLVVLIISNATIGLDKVCPLFGTYLIMMLAFYPTRFLQRVSRYGDFSYGLYIYAFPIQQLLIHISGAPMDPVLNFVITLPTCLVCAILSWHFIEKPALALKDKPLKFWWSRAKTV